MTERHPRLTPRQIRLARDAAETFGARRYRVAMTVHLLSDLFSPSAREIGRALGHADHTSALHHLKRVEIRALPRFHIARARVLERLANLP